MELPPKPLVTADQLAVALASRNLLFVESARLRVGETKNPLDEDLPIRFIEMHLTLQDRDEKVIWVLDKESLKQIAAHFNDILDPTTGVWVEESKEAEYQASLNDLDTTIRQIGEEMKQDPTEAKGALPMGINRPYESGEDGEFGYLKNINGEDLDD